VRLKRVRETISFDALFASSPSETSLLLTDVCGSPCSRDSTSKSKGNKDQGEDGDHENDTDDVELPEKLLGESCETVMSERGGVVVEDTGACGSSLGEVESDDKGKATDRVDDGPHADTPVPGRVCKDGGGNVTGDPGVDLDTRVSIALLWISARDLQ
jgi:hypothetical protein